MLLPYLKKWSYRNEMLRRNIDIKLEGVGVLLIDAQVRYTVSQEEHDLLSGWGSATDGDWIVFASPEVIMRYNLDFTSRKGFKEMVRKFLS